MTDEQMAEKAFSRLRKHFYHLGKWAHDDLDTIERLLTCVRNRMLRAEAALAAEIIERAVRVAAQWDHRGEAAALKDKTPRAVSTERKTEIERLEQELMLAAGRATHAEAERDAALKLKSCHGGDDDVCAFAGAQKEADTSDAEERDAALAQVAALREALRRIVRNPVDLVAIQEIALAALDTP